eukprot:TRINITY_DN5067_c0_g7_i1.p1 TRINITY_DN5067_c0_g7~~TRINITY_DN5067_c0_g7_i1.p1  ORF type:complete len:345 (+),score=77.15 TRINITY_DN5067_c0_g7_i1:75-1109(+)
MAIQDEVQTAGCTVGSNKWITKQKKLAKSVDSNDDGISNTDLRQSSNNYEESTDEASSCDEGRPPAQVGPGLFPSTPQTAQGVESDESEEDEDAHAQRAASGFAPIGSHTAAANPQVAPAAGDDNQQGADEQSPAETRFLKEETILIFDWDDTILPSSWVQGQGLRLDDSCEVKPHHREHLNEVAKVSAKTLQIAKQLGTVVLITNAERGWIELSCMKFLPTLFPLLENVKVLSARTTYECAETSSPLDWKVHAFRNEIARIFGEDGLHAADRRKNCLSLGDSVHEREALMRATAPLPNCRSKSLKFVERPDIQQICKQHTLVTSCFEKIAHHDGNLDLCIRCT